MDDFESYKKSILSRDDWKCQYYGCDKPACQLAHRIGQGKANRKKWGNAIIDHPFNVVSVCEIPAHNDYFNIGMRPISRQKIVQLIEEWDSGEALVVPVRDIEEVLKCK